MSSFLRITTSGIELPLSFTPNIQSILLNSPYCLPLRFIFFHNNADWYLAVLVIFLLSLCFKQLHAFTRPPPVPRKKLPPRPVLQILFTPEEIASSGTTTTTTTFGSTMSSLHHPYIQSSISSSQPIRDVEETNTNSDVASFSPNSIYQSMSTQNTNNTSIRYNTLNYNSFISNKSMNQSGYYDLNGNTEMRNSKPLSTIIMTPNKSRDDNVEITYDLNANVDDDELSYEQSLSSNEDSSEDSIDSKSTDDDTDNEDPFGKNLPDSFAPLLSSSHTSIITSHLTTDLVHALHVESTLRLRPSRHEIPLDQDPSRPQLILDTTKSGGCKVTAVAAIGSDGFSTSKDIDVSIPISDRSCPMVKHAGIVLDPPLPLVNVAPTLIHFPTLFEDNVVKYTLRRIQIVRFALDFVANISSLIEKLLWIIESKCQIHLGKISVTPLYKGSTKHDTQEPQWRLNLAFSGHVLLFGWIPIPFVNITLPTFIIPQPHALLKHLVSKQPLASARIHRERISEQTIALALIELIDTWEVNSKLVVTPPALSVDLTLPGGLTVAVEAMHGTDSSGGRVRNSGGSGVGMGRVPSSETLSTMSYQDKSSKRSYHKRRSRPLSSPITLDANTMVPWKFSLEAKGRIEKHKVSLTLKRFLAVHDPSARLDAEDYRVSSGSQIAISGNLAVCKPDSNLVNHMISRGYKNMSNSNHRGISSDSDFDSVASILLFGNENISPSQRRAHLLQYDYEFDVDEDSHLDAISLSIGASHPMLNGGTCITTVLESIDIYGLVTARADAILDMSEIQRKRNILRHLPAVDFTAEINNIFIPEESESYSDDGQTLCIPELSGGQMKIRVVGGFQPDATPIETSLSTCSDLLPNRISEGQKLTSSKNLYVAEGIRVAIDFFVGSTVLRNVSNVKEFPELEIFKDQKLISLFSGCVDGSIGFHLRPQNFAETTSAVVGRNVFNPLEAYEIDFTGSSVSLKISEANATLGHRRIIIPSETTLGVVIVESIVDMTFEGRTQCELNWDFQGSSPILQVTSVGKSILAATHEERQQCSLLINSLRQGRLNLNVSSVGGLTITQASTSRENREGLYDWKFFNAIISPDDDSPSHIMKVIHDHRTMNKLLQVVKLINADLEKILSYILKQVWRAKEILDTEGVSDPGMVIPGHTMSRLLSLFLCNDISETEQIQSVVRRVVSGDGLDVLTTKELCRKHLSLYEDYAPEIDRVLRFAEVMLGATNDAPKPIVEHDVWAFSELPQYRNAFVAYPNAKQLYATLLDKIHLPLDKEFSIMVARIAPYMSFRQIQYILRVRRAEDWQPADLRRLRYVYAIKKKVMDISESYGGLSFLPQSFFVSVFVGYATRASLRANRSLKRQLNNNDNSSVLSMKSVNSSTLQTLRKRRVKIGEMLPTVLEEQPSKYQPSPAERIASMGDLAGLMKGKSTQKQIKYKQKPEEFDVGDSLLGPGDVAILLQAGLTSSMKSSTVVQLNQRMLLDLMASQPRIFSVAVLAELGSPGSHGNARSLTSALMALLDLDQSSFKIYHRLDMHALLESWLPGFKIPRREDYLAGGRWARQSYYKAMFSVANNILEDAEIYTAFKGHVQRVRHQSETDPIPVPKESAFAKSHLLSQNSADYDEHSLSSISDYDENNSELEKAVEVAKLKIRDADDHGHIAVKIVKDKGLKVDTSIECQSVIKKYKEAFDACAQVLKLDKLAFQADWFKSFYRRNYDALMVKSVYDNVVDDVDEVRQWLDCLVKGSQRGKADNVLSSVIKDLKTVSFANAENYKEQDLIDTIIDVLFFYEEERKSIKNDPLVRLLISNPPGHYSFSIVTAMGVITEGKKGLELAAALNRLEKERGVKTIRADTGTARSFEYNASKIEEAIESVIQLRKPYGILGYSQGCANGLTAESLLLSGTPLQQKSLTSQSSPLVCRQLLFSAANGSMHGPAMEMKIHRLIVMCEEFFKYQQGYCSRGFISLVLEMLTSVMDSAAFHKFISGGGGTFLPEGSRFFWREVQHLPHIPTCVLRGVLEAHTMPESLEMISNLLAKQAGSALHDSQVHVFDAVGHPIYTLNRNAKILKNCDMGGSVQRTHHWSPLDEEVSFVRTKRDIEQGSFLCAKDRHVFPWVDVNVRFGIIKYSDLYTGKVEEEGSIVLKKQG